MPVKQERPPLFALTFEERKETIQRLLETSAPNTEFFLFLVLAVMIVTAGLLIDSGSVVIGGMVVAPVLSPILALGLGVVLSDFRLIRRSLITLGLSVLIVVAISFLMSLFDSNRTLNEEIASRAHVSLIYLIISVASGIAASFALARPNLSATLPGIAVAVALLPPLAVVGAGLSFLDWTIASGAFLLFIVNLVGIIVSTVVVFSLFGFYPVRREAEQKLKQEEEQLKQVRKEKEVEKLKKEIKLEKEVEKEIKKEDKDSGTSS